MPDSRSTGPDRAATVAGKIGGWVSFVALAAIQWLLDTSVVTSAASKWYGNVSKCLEFFFLFLPIVPICVVAVEVTREQ